MICLVKKPTLQSSSQCSKKESGGRILNRETSSFKDAITHVLDTRGEISDADHINQPSNGGIFSKKFVKGFFAEIVQDSFLGLAVHGAHAG